MEGRSLGAVPSARPELTISRLFDAPRELVFEAWTEPEYLLQWWAPKGCSTPSSTVELRQGGAFHYCMRMPDGSEVWGLGTYREIVRPERLVYTDSFADADGNPVPPSHYGMSDAHPPVSLVSVTFTSRGGKTLLSLRHSIPESVPEHGGTRQGWSEVFDRLDDLVRDREERVIAAERVFDAPRELVFRVWTDPEHVTNWWGPEGFTNTIQEMDVRPGGTWRLVMHGPDGTDYPNQVVYDQVREPELLVYTHLGGELGDAYTFKVTVTFAEEDGKTRLTMRMLFSSREARERVVREHDAARGLEQNMDRLGRYLARCRPRQADTSIRAATRRTP